ncbi:RecX family transcriptional regulator [Thalassobaculum sp.]|uniref:regulatory protein RecX n=1 Tax=Thalassobaculum sp. TaxID=2022740 RepID=UPI0032F006C0
MAETTARPPRGRRPRGPLKKSSLENAALYHLERYAASVEGLRRVLARRVEKAAREERCDREEALAWVGEIVERFARSGLVDDRVFAEAKVASRRRRGDSAKRIQSALREKGVDPSIITDALAGEDGEDAGVAELEAAWRLARRRRLGPYRAADQRADARNRDLAALGRAGFGFSTALAVVDADEPLEGAPG